LALVKICPEAVAGRLTVEMLLWALEMCLRWHRLWIVQVHLVGNQIVLKGLILSRMRRHVELEGGWIWVELVHKKASGYRTYLFVFNNLLCIKVSIKLN
jgi:hypothetical protein